MKCKTDLLSNPFVNAIIEPANQGTQTEIVKNEALNRFKAGLSLQVIMQSGNSSR